MRRKIALSNHPAALAARRIYRGVWWISLPAPRAIVRPTLWAFVSLRATYHFLVRVLVCEPLFKAYATRHGRNLKTGVFIHWVEGAGVILLGDDVRVDGKSSFQFATRLDPHPTLEVGDRAYIGHDCSFSIGRRITIGRDCLIAGGVCMMDSGGHPTDPAARRAGLPTPADKVRPIIIGDNVWIGTRCMILPGASIGEGSVVAAGSVVRSKVPPYTLVAGNPARAVASLKPPDSEGSDTPTTGRTGP